MCWFGRLVVGAVLGFQTYPTLLSPCISGKPFSKVFRLVQGTTHNREVFQELGELDFPFSSWVTGQLVKGRGKQVLQAAESKNHSRYKKVSTATRLQVLRSSKTAARLQVFRTSVAIQLEFRIALGRDMGIHKGPTSLTTGHGSDFKGNPPPKTGKLQCLCSTFDPHTFSSHTLSMTQRATWPGARERMSMAGIGTDPNNTAKPWVQK